MPRHVFGDRGLANGDSKFEKLAMDPGRAPEGIGQAHVADQLAHFERDLWSAAARSRFPSPEQTKTSTMPPNDGRWFHDHQGVLDPWCDPIEVGENQTIEIIEGKPLRRFSSQHIELMAQRHDFHLKRGS
jgi:hypothetical protein